MADACVPEWAPDDRAEAASCHSGPPLPRSSSLLRVARYYAYEADVVIWQGAVVGVGSPA